MLPYPRELVAKLGYERRTRNCRSVRIHIKENHKNSTGANIDYLKPEKTKA